MIIEILQQVKDTSRGRICHAIDYVFDVDAFGCPLNRKHAEEVTFIGSSDSLCCADPFHPFNLQGNRNDIKSIDLSDIKHAFLEIEEKNKRVKHPFKHIVISLREGETLSPSSWYELVHDYVKALGYSDNHWIAVHHANSKNFHTHLILSTIENTAPHRKTKDGNDFAVSAKIRHELERKYQLEQDNNPYVTGIPGNRVNNAHSHTKIQIVRDEIDRVLHGARALTVPSFIDSLAETGIGCLMRLNGDNIEGLSFSLGTEYFSGRNLGIGYSWPELNRRGLTFTTEKELDDVLYSIEREQSVSLLVNNAYDNEEEHKHFNHHYLVEPTKPSDTPDWNSKPSYSVYKILTPLEGVSKPFLNYAQSEIPKLRQLRKSLYEAYDFLYSFGTQKIHSLKDYTARCSTKIKFLFERFSNQNPVKRLIAEPNNKACLDSTGLLLVPAGEIDQGEPSSRDYAPNLSDESRPPPLENETILDNPPGVVVMGDYNTPHVNEAVTEQTSKNDAKSSNKRPKYIKRHSLDSDFSF